MTTNGEAPAQSFEAAVEGGRAKAALEVLSNFANDTENLSVNCADMAGYIVIVFCDEGHMQAAMSNGVRSPYSKELAGVLLSKKVEHLFFKDED